MLFGFCSNTGTEAMIRSQGRGGGVLLRLAMWIICLLFFFYIPDQVENVYIMEKVMCTVLEKVNSLLKVPFPFVIMFACYSIFNVSVIFH